MPTTPIDLTALAVGARVQDTFLVWEVETRSQGDGSRFVILTLANASGRLRTAPFWSSELHKVEGLARGAIVRATGDVSEYRGDRQLKVTAIDPVPPGGADLTRLVPSVEGGVAKYWTTLDKWRAEMREGPWKRAVDAFYGDPDFRRAYEQCPGSTNNHHALLGGLLLHTVEVGAIADTCTALVDFRLPPFGPSARLRGGSDRGGTASSLSGRILSGARLVTTIFVDGAASSRAPICGAADNTCSKLSNSSSRFLSCRNCRSWVSGVS